MRLLQLFQRGLVLAVQANSSLIIDGGTDAGIISLVGKALAEQGSPALPRLGVAPLGMVTWPPDGPDWGNPNSGRYPLEPDHTHFLLVDSDY